MNWLASAFTSMTVDKISPVAQTGMMCSLRDADASQRTSTGHTSQIGQLAAILSSHSDLLGRNGAEGTMDSTYMTIRSDLMAQKYQSMLLHTEASLSS